MSLLPVGQRVSLGTATELGVIAGHFVAPESLDCAPGWPYNQPVTFYVVKLDAGAWLDGSDCSTGRQYVRAVVAHPDSVTAWCHGHELPGSHTCTALCSVRECCGKPTTACECLGPVR